MVLRSNTNNTLNTTSIAIIYVFYCMNNENVELKIVPIQNITDYILM